MQIPFGIKLFFGAITLFGFLYLYYSIYVKDAPSVLDKKDARWWDDVLGFWGYGAVKEWIILSFVLGSIALGMFLFVQYFPNNNAAPLFKKILSYLMML